MLTFTKILIGLTFKNELHQNNYQLSYELFLSLLPNSLMSFLMIKFDILTNCFFTILL